MVRDPSIVSPRSHLEHLECGHNTFCRSWLHLDFFFFAFFYESTSHSQVSAHLYECPPPPPRPLMTTNLPWDPSLR